MAHLTVSVDGSSRPRYYLPTICCGPVGNSLSRLNIQAASVVVLCEPQFKPSIENQTISRAYRMGQTRKVFVHRLLCKDTIDERIMQILANKQRIFDSLPTGRSRPSRWTRPSAGRLWTRSCGMSSGSTPECGRGGLLASQPAQWPAIQMFGIRC